MGLRTAPAVGLMLAFAFCGEAVAPRLAKAQSAEGAPPITRQVLKLRHPIGRIFSGTPEALLAFDEERSEFQFVDAATGAIADTQKIEGTPVYLTSYYIGTNRWEFLYTQRNKSGSPAPFSLGILMSKKINYFTSINVFENVTESFALPAAKYAFAFSKEGVNIITWDRSLSPGGYSYNIGGFREKSEVFAKSYPYDLIDFRNDKYMLAISPRESMASLLSVREGYPEDTAYIKELSVNDPAHYSSFAPDTAYGGTGTVVVANGESEVLTVMSVIPGNIPQIDRPLQISLRSLGALAAGNRNVLVAANKSLSVILVGTVGGNQLAVFRKVGGALEELKPIELNFPILDIAVMPRALRSNESEVFVFLGDDKRTLQIEPDINALVASGPSDAHDPSELAFPSSQLDSIAVARLQRALTTLGFSVGTIDGIPGRATTSAVRAFQFKQGLEVSGAFNQETRKALNEAVNKLEPTDRSFVFTPQRP